MVPTSSRAKLNNFVAGNKLNSHFRKSYAVRHEEQIEISAVEKQQNSRFLSPDPWPTPKSTRRIALMMLGTSARSSEPRGAATRVARLGCDVDYGS